MVTGRILQFDQTRGYGFVAADDDGEDVFLHASVFDGDADELAPGMRVEFKVMAGDRGRKAFAAHLIPDDLDPADKPSPVPQPAPPSIPAQAVSVARPTQDPADLTSDDDQMCDVLSQDEFGRELTEVLLINAPTLTGQQIVDVRQGVLEIANKHGWVDV